MRDRRHQPRNRPHPQQHQRDEAEPETLIWGYHAAEAALANPHRNVVRAWLTDNAAHRLRSQIEQRRLAVEAVTPRDLDRRLGPDTVHQGVLIEVEPLRERTLEDLATEAAESGPIVVLDQVTDPHNVGAILRSAAVFGSAGVVLTRRNSPPLGGVLAKAASGALDLVPIAPVQNLARALAELNDLGVTTIGLDGEADELLENQPLAAPTAFVLGAEGRGLRQLTRTTCSRICKIATSDRLASLNVSNAAAIALHLAAMRKRQASK